MHASRNSRLFRACLLFLLLLTFVPQSKAEVTISPLIATGPNTAKSPDKGTFRKNLIVAADTKAAQVGPVGNVASYSLLGTTEAVVDPRYMLATDYHSFGPTVGGTQFGGGLFLTLVFEAPSGSKILLDSIREVQDSTDPYGVFNYTIEYSRFTKFDRVSLAGIDVNNGVKTYLTNNEAIKPVSKLVNYISLAIFPNEDTPTDTLEEITALHKETMNFFRAPFFIDFTFTANLWEIKSSGETNIVAVMCHSRVLFGWLPSKFSIDQTPSEIRLSFEEGYGDEIVEGKSFITGEFVPIFWDRVTQDSIATISIPRAEIAPQQFFRLRWKSLNDRMMHPN